MNSNKLDEANSGQDLVNFVIQASESLHSVIQRAQHLNINLKVKRKASLKKKKKISSNNLSCREQKTKKLKIDTSSDKENPDKKDANYDAHLEIDKANLYEDFNIQYFNPHFEMIDDFEDPELLASPRWKQIVNQNSFIWT